MSILILGSINMDLVTRTPHLPAPGETITGHGFVTVPGGKGANQAVACARLGVPTRMIGRVGNDVFGAALRDSLAENGVDVQDVAVAATESSGIAAIAVDDAAENNIIVVPGANGTVGEEELGRLKVALPSAKILLLQLEVPLEAVIAAAQMAHEAGVLVILDPAPARPLPDELYQYIDIITPNETETVVLVDFPIQTEVDAERAARILLQRGVRNVVIKLGAKGAFVSDGVDFELRPSFVVTAVDSVAAGDAFNGALAVALAEGHAFMDAIQWGIAAGAFAVTQPGAQSAMPTPSDLSSFIPHPSSF